MSGIKSGDRIKLSYESREFDVIVIDPDGLGEGQPSIGFGYQMMEKCAGVPASTLSTWAFEKDNVTYLKLPSDKVFRVFDILGSDKNNYKVVEVSDWFALAVDLLVNPGKTGKGLRAKLGDFIGWFAIKGFYAEAYVSFKGVYTQKDSRATTQWLEARQLGKFARKLYTDLLQAQGCKEWDYANWTNYVYLGLFGIKKSEMVEIWDLVDGDPSIGRNYIPKAEGLDAVRYCEDMVVRLFIDSLDEAHEDAVKYTKRKFLGGA